MEPIRVMHLIDGLGAGGSERAVVNLVNTLRGTSYQPVLCTSRFDGVLSSKVHPEVLRVHLNRQHRFDLGAIKRLANAFIDLDVRIVHAHSTSLFLALAASRLGRRPAVIWHDHYGPPAGLKRSRAVYGPAARRAAAVITVSELLAGWTNQNLGVSRSLVQYVPNFFCRPEGASKLPELPGRSGSRIACVAGVREEKDLLNLVRAMQLVVKQIPDCHLFLIGPTLDHAYWHRVQQMILALELSSNITWLGARTDVDAILSRCDIGLLSSKSEGFPMVLLEYGLARLGVVSTNVGQCAEILDSGRAGLLVPPGNPDLLSRSITSLLLSEQNRRRLGENLASRVSQLYSPEAVIRIIENIYARVLQT